MGFGLRPRTAKIEPGAVITAERLTGRWAAESRMLLRAEMRYAGGIVFGCVHDRVLLAASALACYGRYAWVLRWDFVKPEYRGLGLHRKMIIARLDYLRARGDVQSCRTRVAPDNMPSKINMERCGFVRMPADMDKIVGNKLYNTYEIKLDSY